MISSNAQQPPMLSHSIWLRLLHWLTVIGVLTLFSLGLWMTARSSANLWDSLTNLLYAWHKLIGFTILLLTLVRFSIKVTTRRPPYSQSISLVKIRLATTLHYLLYVLLLLVPLFGWAGVTAYPALITVGDMNLPAMPFITKDEVFAKQLFQIHGYLAFLLGGLILLHTMAGLWHLLINKDGVFQRIWPSSSTSKIF